MYTIVEENYIKQIFLLSKGKNTEAVRTSELANILGHKPSTTTETLDRLSKKSLIWYKKYKGVELSPLGEELALRILRRHRLWESFLVKKLEFTWDEVHEIAEELEHVSFPLLIDRLDVFLDRPKQDPHGEPIPDRSGKMPYLPYIPLSDVAHQQSVVIQAVSSNDKMFLQSLDKMDIAIGQIYRVEHADEDKDIRLVGGSSLKKISLESAQKILVSL